MGLSNLQSSIINNENNTFHNERNLNNTVESLCIMPNDQIIEMMNSPVKKTVYLSKTAVVTCKICGGNYHRNNITAHRKTKIHKAYDQMNEKIRNLLLPNSEEN